MTTKLLSKTFKQLKAYSSIALLLICSIAYAQDPVATSNTEITGVTVYSFFDEQVDIPAGKENYATNIVDNDPDSDWAAQSTTGGELIFNLGGEYELVELQHLTVAKSFAYEFEIFISTNTDPDVTGDYTKLLGAGNQQSNLDATYKSFDLGTNSGVRYVKLKCYGRVGEGSAWNTISELKFYSTATTSVKENELSGFKLYPNPSNNSFFLNDLNSTVNNIQILSLEGKVISTLPLDGFDKELTVDTSFLANGVYLVKLSDTTRNLNATKMIVVKH